MWGTHVIAGALASALVFCWLGAGPVAEAAEKSSMSGARNMAALVSKQSSKPSLEHYVDFSSGGGISDHAKSTYGTATIALGRPLEQNGWRVRLTGGYSESSYRDHDTKRCETVAQELFWETGEQFSGYCPKLVENSLTADERATAKEKFATLGYELTSGNEIHKTRIVKTETYEAAIMPGYQMAFGPFIVKAFAGLAYTGGAAESSNPGWAAEMRFDELWGPRGVLETWLTLSDKLWFSLDASYAAAFQRYRDTNLIFHDYTATARLGYRALPWLTLGPEAAVFGSRLDVDTHCIREGDYAAPSEANDTTRAGGFMKLNFLGTETTLSGGISTDHLGNETAYGSASMYVKF